MSSETNSHRSAAVPAAPRGKGYPTGNCSRRVSGRCGWDSRATSEKGEDAKKGRIAFSLLELLVVMGIIMLLAAMLLSASARSKEQARSATCKSNLHQLGLAQQMYVDDFGHYPACWTIRHGPTNYDEPPNLYAWPARLQRYTANTRAVFLCPSSSSSLGSFPDNFADLTQDFSLDYRYNERGATLPIGTNVGLGTASGVVASSVVAPSDMIALYDADMVGTIWPPPYRGGPSGGVPRHGPPPDTNVNLCVAIRHSGGANFLFCDSHVEYGKEEALTAEEDQPRRRWNIDHEPHPEFW